MSKAKDKPMRFEEAVAELEAIVEKIESGQIGLEECIVEYERGMKMVGRCQEVLSAVQTRITELTADAEGKLRLKGAAAEGVTADADQDEADGDDSRAARDHADDDADVRADDDDLSNPQ